MSDHIIMIIWVVKIFFVLDHWYLCCWFWALSLVLKLRKCRLCRPEGYSPTRIQKAVHCNTVLDPSIFYFILIYLNYLAEYSISVYREILFFFSLFSFKISSFFNWRIIALQNCVVFCQTSTWISHRYTNIPSFSNLPPTSLHWHRALVWVSWAIQQITIGYLFYIWQCKFPCYSFHTSHPLLPSHHVHRSVLYVCFSIAALK